MRPFVHRAPGGGEYVCAVQQGGIVAVRIPPKGRGKAALENIAQVSGIPTDPFLYI